MVDQSTASVSDEDLRDLVLRNPSKGWDALWSIYGPIIRSRIFRFHAMRDHYSDLQQEVSLKIFKDDCSILRKWDPTKGSLAAYLACVTRSVCLDYVKSSFYQYSKRKQEASDSEEGEQDLFEVLLTDDSTPLQHSKNRELSDIFCRTIQELAKTKDLKPEDVSMIYLRARGAEYDQVAAVTGKSKESLMMRFSRIRPLLRAKMESVGVTLEILEG